MVTDYTNYSKLRISEKRITGWFWRIETLEPRFPQRKCSSVRASKRFLTDIAHITGCDSQSDDLSVEFGTPIQQIVLVRIKPKDVSVTAMLHI